MALQLDLTKAARALRVSLDKAGVGADVQAELILDIDVSGSFEHEHEEGTTNKLVARLVPWGMVLDPDRAVDVFTFSHGEGSVHHVGTVTERDAGSFVLDRIVGQVPGWNGGTDYSFALERNLQHFGWLPFATPQQGWLSRFLGLPAPDAPAPRAKKRSIVIFITDGENADVARTDAILKASQDRGDEVYFLFMGACEHDVDFKFLKTVAARHANTGLVIIRDLDGFVDLSDDEMNAKLLVPELIDWLKK
jgi:hypothetical protein